MKKSITFLSLLLLLGCKLFSVVDLAVLLIMKKSFKLAALFVAAAISVAVVSCQKDKETEEPVANYLVIEE